ncbi:hypothetical protein RCL1_007971 [Eukaryota sp. TZLM3-RCL]
MAEGPSSLAPSVISIGRGGGGFDVPSPTSKVEVGYEPIEEHPLLNDFLSFKHKEGFAEEVLQTYFDHMAEDDDGVQQFTLMSCNETNSVPEGVFDCYITPDDEFWITPLAPVENLDCIPPIMDHGLGLNCDFINVALCPSLGKVKKFSTALEALGFYQTQVLGTFAIFGTELDECDSEYWTDSDEGESDLSDDDC